MDLIASLTIQEWFKVLAKSKGSTYHTRGVLRSLCPSYDLWSHKLRVIVLDSCLQVSLAGVFRVSCTNKKYISLLRCWKEMRAVRITIGLRVWSLTSLHATISHFKSPKALNLSFRVYSLQHVRRTLFACIQNAMIDNTSVKQATRVLYVYMSSVLHSAKA